MTARTPRQCAIHEAGHAALAHVLEQLATLAEDRIGKGPRPSTYRNETTCGDAPLFIRNG